MPTSEPARAGARFSVRRLLLALLPIGAIGALIAYEVPFCPSRGLLGIPCPGCGLTRATEAALVGDLATMLHFHPLAPIVTPLVLVAILRVVLVTSGLADPRRFDPLARIPKWMWTVFAVALFGLWIGRMVGLFGGTPDPVDPTHGAVYRAAHAVWVLLFGA